MMKLDTFYNLCKPGLYALCNDKSKKVYIGASVSILTAVNRNVRQIRDNTHDHIPLQDFQDLDLVVLEDCESRNIQQIRMAYWVDYYLALGYTLYRKYFGTRYEVKIDVKPDFRTVGPCSISPIQHLVYVYITNQNRIKIIVGVFESISDANEFITTNYSSRYKYIFYSNNDLTKQYHQQSSIVI